MCRIWQRRLTDLKRHIARLIRIERWESRYGWWNSEYYSPLSHFAHHQTNRSRFAEKNNKTSGDYVLQPRWQNERRISSLLRYRNSRSASLDNAGFRKSVSSTPNSCPTQLKWKTTVEPDRSGMVTISGESALHKFSWLRLSCMTQLLL